MKKYCLLFCTATLLLFTSCGSLKKVTYFQDVDQANLPEYEYLAESQLKILPNDNLYITVSSLQPTGAIAFNSVSIGANYNINLETLAISGYLVDLDGFINFPVLGPIRLGGMTKNEAIEYLQVRISDYIKDPVVNIRFLNFRVTIMGEVIRPGVYSSTEEKLSILEAIGRAGDMTIYGKRENVLIIRAVNGENKSYRMDLTSPDIFMDPNFFLKQNDIVYVQPNKTRAASSAVNPFLSLGISIVSLLATLASITITIVNNNNK